MKRSSFVRQGVIIGLGLAVLFFGNWILSRKVAEQGGSVPKVVDPMKNPFLFPCAGGGSEGVIHFAATLVLDRKFAASTDWLDSEIETAIREQLKFLHGWIESRNQRGLPGEGKVILSARPPQITIGEHTRTSYGLDLVVDQVPTALAPRYVSRALSRGFTKAADPADRISYQAAISVAFCSVDPLEKYLSKVVLPRDPYLAYWYVAKENRRKIAFEDTVTLTNPCATPEIASLNFSSYYWFVWDPLARGQDHEGHPFDCSADLSKRSAVGEFPLSIDRPMPGEAFKLGEPLRAEKGPLRIASFFGPLKPWSIPFNGFEIQKALRSGGDTLDRNIEKYRASNGAADPGVAGFFAFLGRLAEVVDIKSERLDPPANDHVIITVDGHFKSSRREVSLKFYLGSTDASGEKIPGHWPFLLEALRQADLILYVGHAGMGTNLSLSKMAEALGISQVDLKAAVAPKKYQLIAFLSCDAFSYFGQDIMSERHRVGNLTEAVLSAIPDVRYNPFMQLGILRYLDDLLSGGFPFAGDAIRPYLFPNDLLWFGRS